MGMMGGRPMGPRPGCPFRGPRMGRCHTKPATASCGGAKPSAATPACAPKPAAAPAVPDAATREILRNERAMEAAIAASLEAFVAIEDVKETEPAVAAEAESEGESEKKEADEDIEEEVEVKVEVDAPVETEVAADSASGSDSFVELATMEEQFAKELEALNAMGFVDDKVNIALLQEKDGNLRAVVETLIASL